MSAETCVYICDGGPRTYLRRVMNCPVCERTRRFSGFNQAWYGITWTCLTCGDSWTDGEMHERPFRPRWRKESVAKAHADWSRGESFSLWLRSGRALAELMRDA